MASTADINLHEAGPETTSGVGAAVDLVQRTSVDVSLVVSSGVGILAASLETSDDGTDGWEPIGSLPVVEGTGHTEAIVPGCKRFIRATWTVDAPTTFILSGLATLVYCTPADVRGNALHPNAISGVSDIEIDEIARKQTGVANGYLKFRLPLLHWGDDLRARVADLVAYQIMKRRGFNPESADQIVVDAKNDALAWLKQVASGIVIPDEIVESEPEDAQPTPGPRWGMASDAPRYW
jgi:hypothetical protein